MKKWIGRVMLAGLVVLAMAGCGKKEQAAETSAQSGEAKLKAVLVTSTSGLGDRSFLDSTWAGLQQAHDELGVDIAVIEPKTNADYGSSMVAAVNGERILSSHSEMTSRMCSMSTLPNSRMSSLSG